MSRGPAIWATAFALAFVNAGIAALIVEAIGARSFAPAWVGVLLLIIGIGATIGAVLLWRQYLAGTGEG